MNEQLQVKYWNVEPTSKFWSEEGDHDTCFFTISFKVEDYFCYIEEHAYTTGEMEYITRCNAEIDGSGWCMASASHKTFEAAVAQILDFVLADMKRRSALSKRQQIPWTKEELNKRSEGLAQWVSRYFAAVKACGTFTFPSDVD